MIDEAATVLTVGSVARNRGTVHLLLPTDHGPVRLRLTPADAQIIGSQLRLAAVQPGGERRDPSAPIEKPGGGIL